MDEMDVSGEEERSSTQLVLTTQTYREGIALSPQSSPGHENPNPSKLFTKVFHIATYPSLFRYCIHSYLSESSSSPEALVFPSLVYSVHFFFSPFTTHPSYRLYPNSAPLRRFSLHHVSIRWAQGTKGVQGL
jgi:hypothetical protein